MSHELNINTLFALVRIGLWGHTKTSEITERISLEKVDWNEVLRLAQEQGVTGLVAQGVENLNVNLNFKVPQVVVLQFVGATLQMEQRNKAMNGFIAETVEGMRKEGIYTLLVKGQGIAQCYEKPLWRPSGDVDLFLSDSNYEKAKSLLMHMASHVDKEGVSEKHLGMTIDGYVVELHGTLYSGLSSKVDGVLDEVKNDTFNKGNVRSWDNNGVQVFLLGAENNVFYVFTHFLQHFYKEGVGLRQICDWCRLLWTYKDSLNRELLEKRIRRAGLMSEWKVFGVLAIEYLGFPKEYMPLLNANDDLNANLKKKADRIIEFIMMSGNMGHNRDMSHFSKYPYLIRKCVSMGRRISDLINHTRTFPLDSLRFFPRIMFNGLRSAMRGE